MTSGNHNKYLYSKVVICEGKMDRLIVNRLINKRNIPCNFDVVDAGSKDHFYNKISEAVIRGVSSILIIADNDDDSAKAFRNVQAQITKGGSTPPVLPKQLHNKPLPIDVLMLPDTGIKGAIEWLALDVFQRKMPDKTCVDQFVACITRGKWLPQQADKLSLAAYVVGSNEKQPDISMADYFGNGVKDIPDFYLDPIFDDIANYITLFSKA
jgi:hypothetical protein